MNHPWFENAMKQDGAPQQDHQHAIHAALHRLKNFSTANKLKEFALGYLTQHFLNVSDSEELEQVF